MLLKNHRIIQNSFVVCALSLSFAATALSAVAAPMAKAVTGAPTAKPAAPSSPVVPQTKMEGKLPPYTRVVLSNGLTLLLMEKHDLPLISFVAVVRSGSTSDAPGREGTASMTAELLRKGTKTRSADHFSEEVDFTGGSFYGAAGRESTSIGAEFMKKDLDKGLELFSDPILNPTFPQNEFDKLRSREIDSIKASRDRAASVIGRYTASYLYGDHPYARPTSGDETSLSQITRDGVADFYTKNYGPANTIIAAVGDFNTAQMHKDLEQKFGGAWGTAKSASPASIQPTPFHGKKLLFVDKPDSTQTYFQIANVGVSRNNPDRVQIQVVNNVFGGSFTSLLNAALRIKSGLTYGASARFDQSLRGGSFYITTYTKNESTEKAIDMALDVLKQFHQTGITAEQLASAKSYVKGTYPESLETASELAGTIADLEFYGLDRHEIDDYYAKIDATTLDDTKRIIKQYYPLDDLIFVVVGKKSEVGTVVGKYAPSVDAMSISDKGFKFTPPAK